MNDFTVQLTTMAADFKHDLLGLYLSLLLKSKGFLNYDENAFQEGLKDLDSMGGSSLGLEAFILKAKASAIFVDSDHEILNFLRGKKRSMTEESSCRKNPKKSRVNETSDSQKEALKLNTGEEIKMKQEFVGRIDLSLDSLGMSKKYSFALEVQDFFPKLA